MNFLFPLLVVLLVFNVGVFCGFILGSFLAGAKQAEQTAAPAKQFEHQSDAPYPRVWE